MTIAVIDYGMGNLRSVQKALEVVGGKVRLVSKGPTLARSTKIVFPGVGAFGDAMKELRRRGLVGPLKDAIASGTPFLGLCLGMQLLFERSDEAPGVAGLGVFEGAVKRFRFPLRRLKIPHMGWNSIERSPDAGRPRRSALLRGVPDGAFMYFVHSYYVRPRHEEVALTTTEYGIRFTSAVEKGSVFGYQFHPEKSQASGLRILANFVTL